MLKSASPQGKVRLGLPQHALRFMFPQLWPEAEADSATPGPLHGSYLLCRKSTGVLELEIVDAWQGDVARDTRTLSGGEGFLVSLALALALSDLVSHKTSIDSLFLDEGFGSLDGDTLEIALTALDSLNASGKMIGIISHVEALKERIPAQIRVEKGGGIGHSRLVV